LASKRLSSFWIVTISGRLTPGCRNGSALVPFHRTSRRWSEHSIDQGSQRWRPPAAKILQITIKRIGQPNKIIELRLAPTAHEEFAVTPIRRNLTMRLQRLEQRMLRRASCT